jgi:hypothetical protein
VPRADRFEGLQNSVRLGKHCVIRISNFSYIQDNFTCLLLLLLLFLWCNWILLGGCIIQNYRRLCVCAKRYYLPRKTGVWPIYIVGILNTKDVYCKYIYLLTYVWQQFYLKFITNKTIYIYLCTVGIWPT